MPFTPFHMGPGILIKALLNGSFSLMVFGWSQIVMDLQPLFVLLTGEGHLHGFSHTYVGASILAVVSALSGKYLSEIGLYILGLSTAGQKIAWWVAVLSAVLGCFSHVFIDSLMHADMQPWFPFSNNNGLLHLISADTLYNVCLYSGVAGAIIYFFTQYFRTK